MVAPVTHILPLTRIRRERLLPVPGRVQVRSGQKVKPMDVIAEANLHPRHLLLDVSRGLGIPNQEADRLIQRSAGDEIIEGDVIAQRSGLPRRVIRTPVSGRIVMVGEGQVLIETETKPFQVLAGIPGNVTQIIHDRGAVIESTGALIQGVWGNGRIDFGLINVVNVESGQTLTPDQMDVRMRGSIVLGGHCDAEETLQAAAELSLRGLVLGSMPADLVITARKLRFPVIILEGFGNRPINPSTLKLVATNDNREVVINAERFDRFNGTRPELIIPLPAPGQTSLPQDAGALTPGKKVRLIRAPYAGAIGTIAVIRPGLATFPSGIRAPAARVELETGEMAQVPLANLEIIQ